MAWRGTAHGWLVASRAVGTTLAVLWHTGLGVLASLQLTLVQHMRDLLWLQVVRSLRFDGVKIPEGYERRVQRALWTFNHQRVYCPRRRAAVHLHEVAGGDLAAGARVPAAAQVRRPACTPVHLMQLFMLCASPSLGLASVYTWLMSTAYVVAT